MKALIKILVVATLFGSSTVFAGSISAGKASCPSQKDILANTSPDLKKSNAQSHAATNDNGQQAGWTQ